MAVSYRLTPIPGVWGELKIGPWAVQVSRQQYHGQEGESEIRGSRGGRELTLDGMWKNNYTTAAQLLTAIENLNKTVPAHGTLQRTGLINDSYDNCTLMGVEIKIGPLPSTQHGWWAMVGLRFHQLGVD